MKILICATGAGTGDDYFLSLLPVGIGTLAAVLRRAGFQAKAANFHGVPLPEIRRTLTDQRPDLLGISVMTHNRHESRSLATLARELNPACRVVFGGPHATHRWQELLTACPAADFVVLGEGEETLRELAETLSGRRQAPPGTIAGLALRDGSQLTLTPPRARLTDLDSLPPAWTGFEGGINIDLRRQLEFIITSRGCPAACSFCSSPGFWGKALRFRSPRNMVDEIRALRDRYGLIYFAIRDDTFTANRQRVIDFCRLLLEERLFILWNCQSRVSAVDEEMLLWMRRAGCDCIQYGIESGSPALLQVLGKRIAPEQMVRAAALTRRAGIRLSIYLMTGIPDETDRELRESMALLEAIKADDGQVSPLVYYPGTRLFSEAVVRGDVPADLFEQSPEEALPVRVDPFVKTATRKLLRKIGQCAPDDSAIRQEAAAVRLRIGYTPAGNIQTGELLAAAGNIQGAEAQYREIVQQEPDNPWGWLMLGELFRETDRKEAAKAAFTKLAELVPAHLPAWEALAELCRLTGHKREARRCRERIRKLTSPNHEGERNDQSES